MGNGSFSKVYSGVSNKCEKIAVKIISRTQPNSIYEFVILKNLKHLNLVACIEIFSTAKNIYIVMPAASQNLKMEIKIGTFKIRSKLLSAFNQIITGLTVLHDANIVHGDIKPTNILTYPDDIYKISDYSLSCKGSEFKHVVCTKKYRPPECFMGKTWNTSLDVWSVGCVLYEMSESEVLFSDKFVSNLNVLNTVKIFQTKLNSLYCLDLYRLLNLMLQIDPRSRCTTKSLCKTKVEYEICYENRTIDYEFNAINASDGMICSNREYSALVALNFQIYTAI